MNKEIRDISDNYIESYASNRGIDLNKKIICLNPNHNDTKPSMSYDKNIKKFHCFSCNCNYDLLDLIKLDYNLDDKEAYIKMLELYNLDDNTSIKSEKRNISEKDLNSNKRYNFNNDLTTIQAKIENQEKAIKHFRDRGLSEDIIAKYKLSYADKFTDILSDNKDLQALNKNYDNNGAVYVLPFIDEKENISYFMVENAERGKVKGNYQIPKYLYLSGLDREIYNERYIKDSKNIYDTLFITEGQIDTLSIETAGGKSIALGGGLNKRFKDLLLKYKNNIYNTCFIIATDNDKAGLDFNDSIKAFFDDNDLMYIDILDIIKKDKYKEFQDLKDSNDMLLKNKFLFMDLISESIKEAKDFIIGDKLQQWQDKTAYNYYENFLENIKGNMYDTTPTGFKNLDKELDGGFIKQRLIYINGASSTGKTTFTLNIIDNLLKDNYVMYFSLEMSKDQIISRLISKNLYNQVDTLRIGQEISSTDILKRAKDNKDLQGLIESNMKIWQEKAKHLIIETLDKDNETPTIDNIRNTIEKFYLDTGLTPIIVIDYLQLIQPNENNYKIDDEMTIIKKTNKTLKNIAMRLNTMVFIITANNRTSNNKGTADMQSARGSSDIEYSADYYLSINFTDRDMKHRKGYKAPTEEKLKSKNPRNMTITILKNRDGKTGGKIYFDYRPISNIFIERTKQEAIDYYGTSESDIKDN